MSLSALQTGRAQEPFKAVDPGKSVSSIVIAADETAAAEWEAYQEAFIKERKVVSGPLVSAVNYLREGIKKMTGVEMPVRFGGDLSKGLVLATLENAPLEVREDEEVRQALRNTGEDLYNANEAYFIRSEPERVWIVANTDEGLSHGVAALLESVDYEVLGMGPNWVHVPDFRHQPLIFSLQEAGRPGFYIRLLWPTSGQDRGVGTLSRIRLADEADETVQESYQRWTVGTRLAGTSMPRIRGGHALGRYQRRVAEVMRDRKVKEGFLLDSVGLGPDSRRPPAGMDNKGGIWINDDPEGSRSHGKVFVSDGKVWEERDLRTRTVGASLDVSSSLTRGVILDALIEKAEASFSEHPDREFQFATDPEDGSPQFARLAELAKNPDWYPDYLAGKNREFGKYVLNGFHGLNQPVEGWDSNSPSDHIYGFNNWLLWEFDRYIDSLPEARRVTATGRSKKDLVRCNLLSYNYHDVPPNFNLDPRIRIKIAGFPKHRGKGKWANFRSHADMAQAYRLMLPREPSVNYEIWSQGYFHDPQAGNITGSPEAEQIRQKIRNEYEAGFRGFESEVDFNFGKFGLKYYLAARMLWNPRLTAEELDTLRDRWLQRAFGSAWPQMKQYYDFMVPRPGGVNSPHSWAQAIRLLDAASRRIDGAKEPDVQRRIDDVKQFWYFYYLVESGQAASDSKALREFLWKGQMSYMTSMNMVIKRFFDGEIRVDKVLDPEQMGPAHYSHEETEKWWAKVLDFWPLQQIDEFSDAVLADGTKGSEVDVYDLKQVGEFRGNTPEAENIIMYNRLPGKLLRREPARFITKADKAGVEIGFKLLWPHFAQGGKRKNSAMDVPYGISRWNPKSAGWDEVVDFTMAVASPVTVTGADGSGWYLAEARIPAPEPGIYRIEVGQGDFESRLTSLDYDLQTDTASGASGHTYFSPLLISSAASRKWYFYIPRGTMRLDLETSGETTTRLQLYRGLPGNEWQHARTVELKEWGLHRIELQEGEDGSMAVLEGTAFPYLYSVPMLFARTPSALLVPAKIALADGLTVCEE